MRRLRQFLAFQAQPIYRLGWDEIPRESLLAALGSGPRPRRAQRRVPRGTTADRHRNRDGCKQSNALAPHGVRIMATILALRSARQPE